MLNISFLEYKEIVSSVIGEIDTYAPDAYPNPWLCKRVFTNRSLQWAGYQGPIGSQKNSFAFGINLEFIPAWRKIYQRICGNEETFMDLLKRIPFYEWHWWGRPAHISKNPPIKFISPSMLVNEVDTSKWLIELKEILDKKVTWSDKSAMRPQIQIMKDVCSSKEVITLEDIVNNIIIIKNELRPLTRFLER